MNNRYKSLFAAAFAAICAIFVACGNDEFVLSNTFTNSKSYAEFTQDTHMELASFRLDSVRTSGQHLIWIGKCNRPLIGDVCSESVMKLSQLSGSNSSVMAANPWQTKERYDSICVNLYHTGAYQGDTMKSMTVEVLRLAQPLRFADDKEQAYGFYNCRTFRDSVSIGSYRFRPKPHARRHIHFRIDDKFGQELIDFFRTYAGAQEDVRTKAYEAFLGGIKIKATDDAQNLMAFLVDSFNITLHSHLKGIEELRQRRYLIAVEKEKQYNQIWTENTEVPFDKLTHVSKSVTEGETELRSVMFEGLGYYTRVNFDDLAQCFARDKKAHIVRANLILYPERGMYDKHNFPSSFYLWDVGKGNVLTSPVYNDRNAQVRGYLHYNVFDENDVYYIADLTYYLNTKLAQGYGDRNIGVALTWGAGMSPTDYNFMVFRGNGYRKYNSRIEIYYYYYDREDI